MPSQKKIEVVKKLSEKIKESKALYLFDYQGLTHKQLEEIKRKAKEFGGSFLVTKNSLLLRAASFGEKMKNLLKGPTAVLFAGTDETSPLSAIYNTFIKTLSLPKIKGGILKETFLEAKETERLAALPSKEVLIGQFAGLLKYPIIKLDYVLRANLRKLVFILKEVTKRGKTN